MYQGITNSFATPCALRTSHKSIKSKVYKVFFTLRTLRTFHFQLVCKAHSVRLACLIHAASVHPGPGSNPLNKFDCRKPSNEFRAIKLYIGTTKKFSLLSHLTKC